MTTTTYVSQNIGAGCYSRAKNGLWYCLGVSAVFTAVLTLILVLFTEPAARLFSQDPAVIEACVGMVRFFVPFYGVMVVREVTLGYLRGYGRSRVPMLLTLAAMVGLRQIYLALATAHWPGEICVIYSSFPTGWTFAMLFLLAYLLLVRKRMWKEAEEKT